MAASMLFQVACFLVIAIAIEEAEDKVPVCPMLPLGDAMVAVVPTCKVVCAVSSEYLEEGNVNKSKPLHNPRCPQECPTLAPCSQPRHLMCIIGSRSMDFHLKYTHKLNLSARILPDDTCQFYDPSSVVRMPNANASSRTSNCAKCNVSMCEICNAADLSNADRPDQQNPKCIKCQKSPLWGFTVSSNSQECEDRLQAWWNVLLVVLGGWGAVRMLWVFYLPCRKTVNCYLWQAIRAKWVMTPLQNGKRISWWRFWEWHWKDRQGVGLMLFFNFHVFVAVAVASAGYIHWRLHNATNGKNLSVYFDKGLRCPLGDDPLWGDEDLYRQEVTEPMMWYGLYTYGAVLALSFIFAIINSFCLRCFRVRHMGTSLDGYVLQVEGLPPDLLDARKIEEYYEGICQEIHVHKDWDCDPEENLVVGASLVFATQRESQIAFDEVVNALVDRKDIYMANEKGVSWETYDEGTVFKRRNSFITWLDCTYGFKGRPNLYVTKNYLEDPISTVRAELTSLRPTGNAFVVFKYRHVADAVEQYLREYHKKELLTPKLSWFMRQLTGRSFDIEKYEYSQRRRRLGRTLEDKKMAPSATKKVKYALKKLTMPLLEENQFDFVPLDSCKMEDGCVPFTRPVTAIPEDVCWDHFGFSMQTVKSKLEEIPSSIFLTVLQALALFIPTTIYLAKQSFLSSNQNNTFQWRMKTAAMGMMAEFGKFLMRLTVIQKASKFGAVTRERQDQVIYVLIVLTDAVLLAVKYSFAITITKEAWVRHEMVENGDRPTTMSAFQEVLFRLIWPGGIALGYIMEPFNSIILPQMVNKQVCRCDPYPAHKSAMALRFSSLRSKLVKMYSDLIVKTTLVFALFFMVSDKAAMASMYWAGVLACRYAYLTVVWARFATESRVNTSRLANVAMQLWSMPLALLAAVASYHTSRWYLGLRLPPLDLAGGPTKWVDNCARAQMLLCTAGGTILGTLLWLHVLYPLARAITSACTRFCCRKCFNPKHFKKDLKESRQYPYPEELRPANFFNTNIPLVLIAQLVCRGDPDCKVACLPKAVRERGQKVLRDIRKKLKDNTMTREQDYLVYGTDHPDGLLYNSRPGCCIGDVAPLGSTVKGVVVDEKNGWLRVEDKNKGTRFLPFFVKGEPVLIQERKLLEREAEALAAFDTDMPYVKDQKVSYFSESKKQWFDAVVATLDAEGSPGITVRVGEVLRPIPQDKMKTHIQVPRAWGQMPPTQTGTGLDDRTRQDLTHALKSKFAQQIEDIIDKRISENAAKVLHPFVLGKEYQQPNMPNEDGSLNGSDFLKNFEIRAPWNQTRGVLERVLSNYEQFLVPLICLSFAALLLGIGLGYWYGSDERLKREVTAR